MSQNDSQPPQLTTDISTLSDLLDEGCVIDIEEARGVSTGGAPLLPIINAPIDVDEVMRSESFNKSKDSGLSGLSSRMSETDGDMDEKAARSLLHANGEGMLTKRLTRISECQYEEPCRCSVFGGIKAGCKIGGVCFLLYVFICNLDLLSNAFRLLGGRTAGSVFSDNELLLNPITGLMIGVMATVLLQSSSTSSSIVITMVASNILPIQPAIPIIMGANIGTTVTNTLVSLAHSMDRKEFRRAFSGAVVHDVFNWLTVLILLPTEYCTGYLYHLTHSIISTMNLENVKHEKKDLLKKLTKPLTSKIVVVDKKVITGIAEGKEGYANKSLLKEYCTFDKVKEYVMVNTSTPNNSTGDSWSMVNTTTTVKRGKDKCDAVLNSTGWDDTTAGALLFVVSIILLSFCLYLMVKLLHSLLGGHIAKAARKTINADFPRPFHWLTGYVAIIVGAGMTILVQSSSVFTSALTPLVGVGCLKLERMFPLTLGSNIGTTFTGVLAALAAPPETMSIALQLAFCHLFFNISGILIFYPVPRMRQIVISTAKYLGRTTATYRWFAIAYLIFMFILFPVFFFSLSMAGTIAFVTVLSIIGALAVVVVIINILQRHKKTLAILPEWLRNWQFLPECLRSLAPYDRGLRFIFSPFLKCCCECCLNRCKCLTQEDVDMGCIDSDDDSCQTSYLPSAASSKMLLSSSPNSDSKDSGRIYKPKNSSRKSNGGKKSPVNRKLKHDTLPESHTSVSLLPSSSANSLSAQDRDSANGSDPDVDVHSSSSLEEERQSKSGNGAESKSNEANHVECDLSSVDIDKLRESKI